MDKRLWIPRLQAYDFDGLRTMVAFFDRKLNSVTSPQMADPIVCDGRIVDENFVQTIGLNVAKAFGTIKAFYRAYDTR